ncbi:unnamed protein product [Brachionus calyciflorus]|uniref:Uncharacterized protein n=1 Tax=Brachionus calyciflorus TaxID=104777 RepID=A0A814DSF2_9BILA|nr:unnamed protein product [Brachionus calyciflorus]
MSKVNQHDLVFLNQNLKISTNSKKINSNKNINLLEKRNRKFHISEKLHHGNPNIDVLLKDIRVQPSLTDLQNDLKKEFNDFISSSINDSIKKFKTTDNLDTDENSFFLTQIGNPSRIEFENYDHHTTTTSLIERVKTPSKDVLKNRKLEIALIPDEKESKKFASLVQLKEVIQNLKTTNLPKFQSEFHQLCQFEDDDNFFKKLNIENNSRVLNEKNGLGRCGIHECCIRGNSKLLKLLLPSVKSINSIDINGYTAAHIAAKFGQLECLKILYENGIDMGKRDNYGKQITHLAAEFNHANIIEFCLELNISMKAKCNDGKMPIHYACQFGSLEALKSIVSIDISIRDYHGNSAAHLAVRSDRLNCLKYMIKIGLPINIIKNKMGRNVPHEACFYGAINCLHWMFENNQIDLNIMDDLNNTLAHTCCMSGQAECLNCCIQHNVDINKLNVNAENALELARKVGKGLHIEKAVNNEITCKECVENALRYKFEKENEKTVPEQIIEKNYAKMYHVRGKEKTKIDQDDKNKKTCNNNVKRDLVAQFFGPEI